MKRQWTSMRQAGMRALGMALTAILVNGCGEPASAALAPTQREQKPLADARGAAAAAPVRAEDLAYHDRQKSEGEIADAFGPTAWYVPPPPPPPPAPVAVVQEKAPPPPKPTAPPLPFQYLGRYADGTSQVVMLVKGDQIYTVSEGETIDGSYRVEHVAAGAVELRYLPLDIKQSVLTGDAS